MLYRLLLQRVHLRHLVFQRCLEELLSFGDGLRYLRHLLDRILDVIARLLADQVVLHGLLVAHLFDQVGDLLHGLLHLGHNVLLAVERLLLFAPLDGAEHLDLSVKPSPQVFLVLRTERNLVLQLAS